MPSLHAGHFLQFDDKEGEKMWTGPLIHEAGALKLSNAIHRGLSTHSACIFARTNLISELLHVVLVVPRHTALGSSAAIIYIVWWTPNRPFVLVKMLFDELWCSL